MRWELGGARGLRHYGLLASFCFAVLFLRRVEELQIAMRLHADGQTFFNFLWYCIYDLIAQKDRGRLIKVSLFLDFGLELSNAIGQTYAKTQEGVHQVRESKKERTQVYMYQREPSKE
jgi:hypothetical protein